MIVDYNDEANFPNKWSVTDTQVSRLRKTFTNNSSANLKLSKTQLFFPFEKSRKVRKKNKQKKNIIVSVLDTAFKIKKWWVQEQR